MRARVWFWLWFLSCLPAGAAILTPGRDTNDTVLPGFFRQNGNADTTISGLNAGRSSARFSDSLLPTTLADKTLTNGTWAGAVRIRPGMSLRIENPPVSDDEVFSFGQTDDQADDLNLVLRLRQLTPNFGSDRLLPLRLVNLFGPVAVTNADLTLDGDPVTPNTNWVRNIYFQNLASLGNSQTKTVSWYGKELGELYGGTTIIGSHTNLIFDTPDTYGDFTDVTKLWALGPVDPATGLRVTRAYTLDQLGLTDSSYSGKVIGVDATTKRITKSSVAITDVASASTTQANLASVSNSLASASASTAAGLTTVSNTVTATASGLTTVSNSLTTVSSSLTATASGLTVVSNTVTATASGLTAVSNSLTATTSSLTTVSNAAVAALPKSGGIMTGSITFAGSQATATTNAIGLVQLTHSVTSTNLTTAATPASVKLAYDFASSASNTLSAQILATSNAIPGVPFNYAETVVVNGSSDYVPLFLASQTGSTYRKAYTAVADCSELRLHYGGFYPSAGTLVALNWSGTASIQLADAAGNPTGAAIPVTFNGAGSFSVNGTVARSDAIKISLAKGQKFFVLTYNSTSAFPCNCRLNPLSGENIYYGGDVTRAADSMVNDSSQIGISALAPNLITGLALDDVRDRAVIAFGDSILQGYWYAAVGDKFGWLGLALGNSFGYVNAGLGGSASYGISTSPAAYDFLFYPAKYCGIAVYALGFNDFFGGQDTAANVQGYASTIVTRIRANGIAKVIGCTVLPASTSTDGWTSTTQTPKPEGGRTAYNAWVMAGSGTPFDGAYDFNASLALSSNLQKRDPGPGTVLATFAAGTGSSIAAIRTTDNATGSASWAGATVRWIHGSVTNYGQVMAYRPSLSGGLNIVFTSGLVGTEQISPGDSVSIIDSWDGDVAGGGGHPNGYGHVHAASVAAATLVPLISSFVPADPVGFFLPLTGGTVVGTLNFSTNQPTGTTNTPGILKLTDSISSTDTTTAATANSVRLALAAAGTVTNVSVATANGISGTVANPTTNPSLTLSLGAITPGSITTSGQIVGASTGVAYSFGSDTNTGIGHPSSGVVGLYYGGAVKAFVDGPTGHLVVNKNADDSSGAQVQINIGSGSTHAIRARGYGIAPSVYMVAYGGSEAMPTKTTSSNGGRYVLLGTDTDGAGVTEYVLGGLEIFPNNTLSTSDHGTSTKLSATPAGTTARVANVLTTGKGVSISRAAATTPGASSTLELQGTDGGFVPNKLTTAQRNALASPVANMIIGNTDTGYSEQYNGSAWVQLMVAFPTVTLSNWIIPGITNGVTLSTNVTVSGVVQGAFAVVDKPFLTTGLVHIDAVVTAANTVTLYANSFATTTTAQTNSFNIRVIGQ